MSNTQTASASTLVIRRTFAAPRERVFAAWTGSFDRLVTALAPRITITGMDLSGYMAMINDSEGNTITLHQRKIK